MNQDIEDALARLRHAIDHSAPFVPQASQLSDADARTASALAQGRIRELETQLIAERGRADAMARERRALCDILSADSSTIAGQTLVEAVRAIIAERDAAIQTHVTELGHVLAFTRCPRCGAALNNLSPGISVVAGGVHVCTSCLHPGETEIARAKGVEMSNTDITLSRAALRSTAGEDGIQ